MGVIGSRMNRGGWFAALALSVAAPSGCGGGAGDPTNAGAGRAGAEASGTGGAGTQSSGGEAGTFGSTTGGSGSGSDAGAPSTGDGGRNEPGSPEGGTGDGESGGSGEPARTGGRASTGGAATGGSGTGGVRTTTGGAESGVDCVRAADCGDTSKNICNPEVGKCGAFECGPDTECSPGMVCLPQVENPVGGACYAGCTPFSAPCSGERDCVPVTFDNVTGVCLGRGTGTGSCSFSSVSTGCAAGMRCVQQSCRSTCDFFKAAPGCPADQRCDFRSVCDSGDVDSAGVGEPCAADADGKPCGDDGGSLRGVCLDNGSVVSCYGLCREATADCGSGGGCLPISDALPGLGVCTAVDCQDGGAAFRDCDTCLAVTETACCAAEASACAVGSPCDALVICLNECANDDRPCVDACAAATPGGVAPFNALAACWYGDGQGTLGACSESCL